MVTEISVQETRALLDSGALFHLIDCREANEYAFCRIEGAELVPLSRFAGEIEAKVPDRNALVVIYCHAGVRSARAAGYMTGLGYTNVRSMRGGIEAWSLEVDPSVPRY